MARWPTIRDLALPLRPPPRFRTRSRSSVSSTGSCPCITSTSAACSGYMPRASIKPSGGTGVTRLRRTSRSASPARSAMAAKTITGRGQLSKDGSNSEDDLALNYAEGASVGSREHEVREDESSFGSRTARLSRSGDAGDSRDPIIGASNRMNPTITVQRVACPPASNRRGDVRASGTGRVSSTTNCELRRSTQFGSARVWHAPRGWPRRA